MTERLEHHADDGRLPDLGTLIAHLIGEGLVTEARMINGIWCATYALTGGPGTDLARRLAHAYAALRDGVIGGVLPPLPMPDSRTYGRLRSRAKNGTDPRIMAYAEDLLRLYVDMRTEADKVGEPYKIHAALIRMAGDFFRDERTSVTVLAGQGDRGAVDEIRTTEELRERFGKDFGCIDKADAQRALTLAPRSFFRQARRDDDED